VARREDETVERPLLALGHERPSQAEQRREENRNPQQPAGLEPRWRPGECEVEDDEHRGDEEKHRRQRVPRPQLEQEVLASERSHVAGVAHHASASLPLARGSTRTGSCVARTNEHSPRSSTSCASNSSAPASSSAEYGSSRTSSSGSWR